MYVIINAVEIKDAESFKSKMVTVVSALPSFGGHLLADSSSPSSLDGDIPQRFLVIAFGNVTDINSWKESPAYKVLDNERDKAAKVQVFSVDGLPDAAIALSASAINGTGQVQTTKFYPVGDQDRKKGRAVSNSIQDICKGC
ncbi:DUF1330 domain-containing protein [Beijerinckia sp. L45]|uniref:DUF1330 domain-containing protein n=1 Tax=Beijerinckia sp. L45 TaxID=1641855 RepID=UPI00131AF1B6|nr:DUF1330 domain-containing protein [Beijerinckia sp. L45]